MPSVSPDNRTVFCFSISARQDIDQGPALMELERHSERAVALLAGEPDTDPYSPAGRRLNRHGCLLRVNCRHVAACVYFDKKRSRVFVPTFWAAKYIVPSHQSFVCYQSVPLVFHDALHLAVRESRFGFHDWTPGTRWPRQTPISASLSAASSERR
jgi:hypothetical protein